MKDIKELAPPEQAQNLYREIYEVWSGSEGIPMPRTAPEAYLLGLLEQMVDIAKTGMHMTEPAPQQLHPTHEANFAAQVVLGAAPSSGEVARMVERLRLYESVTMSVCLKAADALEALEQRVAALVAERAKSAEQYVARLNQIDALTKERNEFEISNAFAHGEWRAAKDQLAAMTKERDELLGPNPVEQMIRDQLAAAQARESKLRSVLQWVLRASDLSLKEIGAYMVENGIASMPASEGTAESFSALQAVREAIALPTDDSALMERLKQEREKFSDIVWSMYKEGPEAMDEAIRSMT